MRSWNESRPTPRRAGLALALAALLLLPTFPTAEWAHADSHRPTVEVAAPGSTPEPDARVQLVFTSLDVLNDGDPAGTAEWDFYFGGVVRQPGCEGRPSVTVSLDQNLSNWPWATCALAGESRHLTMNADTGLNPRFTHILPNADRTGGGFELREGNELVVGSWGSDSDTPFGACFLGDCDDWLGTAVNVHTAADGWGIGRPHVLRTGYYALHYQIRRVPSSDSVRVGSVGPVVHAGPVVRLAYPDLDVAGLRVARNEDGSGRCEADVRNSILVTIRNAGSLLASPFAVRIAVDDEVHTVMVTDDLGPGEDTDVHLRTRLDGRSSTIRVTADPDNAIIEWSEGNNVAAITVVCARA